MKLIVIYQKFFIVKGVWSLNPVLKLEKVSRCLFSFLVVLNECTVLYESCILSQTKRKHWLASVEYFHLILWLTKKKIMTCKLQCLITRSDCHDIYKLLEAQWLHNHYIWLSWPSVYHPQVLIILQFHLSDWLKVWKLQGNCLILHPNKRHFKQISLYFCEFWEQYGVISSNHCSNLFSDFRQWCHDSVTTQQT